MNMHTSVYWKHIININIGTHRLICVYNDIDIIIDHTTTNWSLHKMS